MLGFLVLRVTEVEYDRGLESDFSRRRTNQGFVGRIEVKAHDIVELLDESLVAAEFEGFDQMGFQVVLLPNSVNGGLAETLSLGHAARTPMRCVGRSCVQGSVDNSSDLALRDSWNTARARGILFQARKPKSQEALSPQLDGGPRNLEFVSNTLIQQAIGSHSDNPSTLDKPVREISSRGPAVQRGSFVCRQRYGFGNSHADLT